MSAEPIKTTTAEALLGMLGMSPMSGYELRQRIELSIGNFWSESFGQIYPTLRKLEASGLVSMSEEGKAGRKVYTLTPAGREHLEEWLGVAARPRVPRNEALLKLFFSEDIPVRVVEAHIMEIRDRYADDLRRYEATGAHIRREYAHMPGLPYWLMTLDYGRREACMLMEWSDATLTALSHIEMRASGALGIPENLNETRSDDHAR